MIDTRFTPKYEREMEQHFENQREAFRLLDLINAEFQSDPMSVQCFDARIVQRVKQCVEKWKRIAASNPLYRD